jgi:hypothetical protein
MRLENLVAEVPLRFLLWDQGCCRVSGGCGLGCFGAGGLGGYCGDRGSAAGDVGWGVRAASRSSQHC